jgi:hypothetical protein
MHTLAIAAIFSAFASSPTARVAIAQQRQVAESPDDRTAPPRSLEDSLKKGFIRVVRATLTPISTTGTATNAVLAVRFEPNRPAGSTVTISPEGKAIVLHDDGTAGDSVRGDQILSATISLDSSELSREAEAVKLLQNNRTPQFRGRVQLPPLNLPPEAFQDLRNPILHRPIPLVPLGILEQLLKDRSLMITDPNVIHDPTRTFDVCTGVGTKMGKWTFGYLMTQMANQAATGQAPAAFTRDWLHQWEVAQNVNTFTIPARPQIRPIIIDPWPTMFVSPWFPFGPRQLDLRQAPFRLLAIVNRVDLRQNLVYGGGSAGEGRFVFEAIDRRPSAPGGPPGCRSLPFTVIFEYGIHKNSCIEARDWGQQWYNLRTLAPNTVAYRNALENITEQFVRANANPSQTPNRSALSQLRTNEIALASPWELREFRFGTSGLLTSVTTKKEPDQGLLNTDRLVAWINANNAAVAHGTHSVPLTFPDGTPFLGSRAPVANPSVFWDRGASLPTPTFADLPAPPAITVRQQFSLGTCSGCHAGETGTQFTHVKPASMQPPALSGFLTGISVPDPEAPHTPSRTYNDLAARAISLSDLVHSSCLRQLVSDNISMMTH